MNVYKDLPPEKLKKYLEDCKRAEEMIERSKEPLGYNLRDYLNYLKDNDIDNKHITEDVMNDFLRTQGLI